MSYTVLARKWRPMQFADVVAQDHVSTTLMNAVKNQRLASAYLFSGPRGVGKTTSARIFAKTINCDNGPTPTPCNNCPSCKEITEGRSLDVFEIDGASNRGIDEVRNLRENLKYAASKGKHKIYIIDEVHMLTTEAFNALLKTLEEPPRRVLFIFATTEPHKVPPTILSRCQRYDFRRIPLKEIVQQLQKICKEESIKIDDESLYLIAKKSEGSMRDSQSLLDQVVSFCGTAVTVTELSELLGIIDTELFFEFTACVAQRDVLGGLQLVERIFHQGCDIAEFLNGLTEHFRNMLVLKTTNNAELIEGLESYAPRYQEAAKSFSEYDLLRFIKMSSETANGVKRAANPKMMLELLLVKMIKMEKSVELDELLNQLQGIKPTPKSSTGGSGPATHLASYSALPTEGNPIIQANPIIKDKTDPGQSLDKSNDGPNGVQKLTDVSLTQIKEKWADIIGEVKGKRIHLGSFLNEGYPTDLQNGVLEISFGKENGFHINALNQNKMLIENAILIQTGFKLRVQCKKNERADFKEILLNHRPVVAEAAKTIDEESMRQSPIVQKVIEVFDGEIVG